MSKAKAIVNAEYAIKKRIWWGDGRRCEFPKCRKMAEKQPHHQFGRAGRLQNDTRHWKALCIRHHMWIDWNRDAARALGLLCPWGHWNDYNRMIQYYEQKENL
ncbi:MAG: hypothetical protein WC378_17840 [Opitutaceae bacterium]